ncbi:hypothetical protein OF83DRAFT_469856 [Amylostereum chailletii]|nr:hypothetical protein OF83DRAFT_469856 [Amylostereum chailletii]
MNILNLNSIGSLTINGILNRNGTPCPARLTRVNIPKDLVKAEVFPYEEFDPTSVYREVPSRPESVLPPSECLHATATIGEKKGAGSNAVVHELNKVRIRNSPHPVRIPPLVVKIAFTNRVEMLAREAWFYDEMESLQGSVIPRCYGWFEMDLRTTSPDDAPYTIFNWPKFAADPDPETETGELPHPMLTERASRQDILSIIVLEKLRGPFGRNPSGLFPRGSKKDIRGLFSEVQALSINLVPDISENNILRAARPSALQPAVEAPHFKGKHKYRLVDFGMATKSNRTPASLSQDHFSEVIQMFENIPDIDVPEPQSTSSSDSEEFSGDDLAEA